MKSILACIMLILCIQSTDESAGKSHPLPPLQPVQNLFIITIDGFRWQELFTGADSTLINDERYCLDTETMKMLYWDASSEERRRRLMPFFWSVVAAKGQIYGNRLFNNKVNVSNIYSLSYPGYNEIFTGGPDLNIRSNNKKMNSNLNVLEWLNGQNGFKGNVVAFTSWDVFPYILNKDRSELKINSGYGNLEEGTEQSMVNQIQSDVVDNRSSTRYDELTFITAREYIQKNHPKIVFMGFGETDELAHHSRYDLYLEKAAKMDKIIGELWYWVQSTPGYKDNTTFIITTDHGRGSRSSRWKDHGLFVKGSSQTWLAIIGPQLKKFGEMKGENQIYQEQVAQTIANLVGKNFESDRAVAPAISIK